MLLSGFSVSCGLPFCPDLARFDGFLMSLYGLKSGLTVCFLRKWIKRGVGFLASGYRIEVDGNPFCISPNIPLLHRTLARFLHGEDEPGFFFFHRECKGGYTMKFESSHEVSVFHNPVFGPIRIIQESGVGLSNILYRKRIEKSSKFFFGRESGERTHRQVIGAILVRSK